MPKMWKEKRHVITQLYTKDNKTCEEVRRIMRDQHNFKASIRSFRQHFKEWDLKKYKRKHSQNKSTPYYPKYRSVRSSSVDSSPATTPDDDANFHGASRIIRYGPFTLPQIHTGPSHWNRPSAVGTQQPDALSQSFISPQYVADNQIYISNRNADYACNVTSQQSRSEATPFQDDSARSSFLGERPNMSMNGMFASPNDFSQTLDNGNELYLSDDIFPKTGKEIGGKTFEMEVMSSGMTRDIQRSPCYEPDWTPRHVKCKRNNRQSDLSDALRPSLVQSCEAPSENYSEFLPAPMQWTKI